MLECSSTSKNKSKMEYKFSGIESENLKERSTKFTSEHDKPERLI